MYFSEPAPAPRISLPGGVSVTLWDQWTINGNSRFTMQNFLDAVKKKYSLNVSSILLGSKMVYMPFMPEHRKRLPQPFHNHLDPLPTNEDYVDLSVDMEADEMGDGMMDDVGDEVNWPPVRYYFRWCVNMREFLQSRLFRLPLLPVTVKKFVCSVARRVQVLFRCVWCLAYTEAEFFSISQDKFCWCFPVDCEVRYLWLNGDCSLSCTLSRSANLVPLERSSGNGCWN